ncbi:metallophosphoesterase [Xanthomonas phage JGB6]|nr:metallophosphoesterase [Xanthomonas phage JGB6]
MLEEYLMRHENIIYLDKEIIEHQNVLFYGATTWTDFNVNDRQTKIDAVRTMVDYDLTYIEDPNDVMGVRKLNPDDVYEDHLDAVRNLQYARIEAREHDKKLVVMTHHAPSAQSIIARYKNDPSSAYYYTDLEQHMDDPVVLWVHGHTHRSAEYRVGSTLVGCNPRGHVKYPNPEFTIKGIDIT